MDLSEYISANAPVAILPELFGIHHPNPLGIPVVAQLIVIVVLAAAMFSLLGLTIVATFQKNVLIV